jgi:hypothetical protein
MSTGFTEGDPTNPGAPASEEEMRAAYEAEIKQIRVEHVMLEQVISMINLGMRRTGLAPGTEDERDLGQVRTAIEAIRVLMPLVEQVAASQAGAIREALSQLQLAFVRLGGTPERDAPPAPPASGSAPAETADRPGSRPNPAPGARPPGDPAKPGEVAPESGEGGPAQRSGRLWIPGQ